MAKREDSRKAYTLEVPLDASAVEGFKPEQEVKVAVYAGKRILASAVTKLSAAGKGTAAVKLPELVSGMRAVVGPANASDEELAGLQTIRVDVPARQLLEKVRVKLPPVVIHPYYWWWWLRWCRAFTIHGVLLCPNGEPVPGATVCAYDVDWWWWWTSNQQVGCATTDINGAFEINFRWCCGWWPWWWWHRRFWRLEPLLVDRIQPVLQRDPRLPTLPTPSPRPDLSVFEGLVGDDVALDLEQRQLDPAQLEPLREQLLKVLPRAPELEQLRIWPWWPWHPWWDCTPDIIFRATHDCPDPGTVILSEGFFDTRWNIDTNLNVVLTANDQACCLEPPPGCLEGDCLALTMACDDVVDTIGGNIDAPATPLGYKNPGGATLKADRPYAGRVPIGGTMDCMEDYDYYEFETGPTAAGPWTPVPPEAAGSFTRKYLQFSDLSIHPIGFATTGIDGHHVFETLKHYEDGHPPADWGANRVWLSNRNRMMNWLTLDNYADGTYYLHVKGYHLIAPNNLDAGTVLHICENPGVKNYIVLTIDNQVVTSGGVDVHGHDCGAGSVHKCTAEPDVDFLAVKILHADSTETDVTACGEFQVNDTDRLQIDLVAHDPDGHLAKYTLAATWGESDYVNILGLGGVSYAPSPVAPAWAPAPAVGQEGPTYADALADDPTIRPDWHGGSIRVTVDAAQSVFVESCCYQLELYAHKRTILNCNDTLWGHWNLAQRSFMIEVV